MEILINRIIAVFAILSASFAVSLAGLYFGYFLYIDPAFMPFFSVSDFTSQAVILLPVLGFIVLFVAIGAQYIYQYDRQDAGLTRKWLNRIVIGAVALMSILGIAKLNFEDAVPIDGVDLCTAAVVVALIYAVHTLYEENILKSPTPIAQGVGYLLISGSVVAILVAAGAQWARFDMQQGAKFCITTDQESFAAVVLRTSSAGFLFKREGRPPELRSSGAVKAITSRGSGSCHSK
jgi:hypothetical protein